MAHNSIESTKSNAYFYPNNMWDFPIATKVACYPNSICTNKIKHLALISLILPISLIIFLELLFVNPCRLTFGNIITYFTHKPDNSSPICFLYKRDKKIIFFSLLGLAGFTLSTLFFMKFLLPHLNNKYKPLSPLLSSSVQVLSKSPQTSIGNTFWNNFVIKGWNGFIRLAPHWASKLYFAFMNKSLPRPIRTTLYLMLWSYPLEIKLENDFVSSNKKGFVPLQHLNYFRKFFILMKWKLALIDTETCLKRLEKINPYHVSITLKKPS